MCVECGTRRSHLQLWAWLALLGWASGVTGKPLDPQGNKREKGSKHMPRLSGKFITDPCCPGDGGAQIRPLKKQTPLIGPGPKSAPRDRGLPHTFPPRCHSRRGAPSSLMTCSCILLIIEEMFKSSRLLLSLLLVCDVAFLREPRIFFPLLDQKRNQSVDGITRYTRPSKLETLANVLHIHQYTL